MLDGLIAGARDQASMNGLASVPSLVWITSGLDDEDWPIELTQALVTALQRHPDTNAREAAAAALGAAPTSVWTTELAQALAATIQQDPAENARKAAAAAIGAAPAEVWTIELARALATSSEPDARDAAVAALGTAPAKIWTPEFAQALATRLDPQREDSPWVRAAVAESLRAAPASVWSPELTLALVASLDPQHEDNPEVRSEILNSLQAAPTSVWSAELTLTLVASLDPQREDGPGVRRAVAEALGAAPASVWTPKLALALATSLDLQRKDSSIVREDSRIRRMANGHVSEAIATALRAAPASVWTPELALALVGSLDPQREDNARVRRAVAEALGTAPTTVWSPKLAQALATSLDPQREGTPWVREAAAAALLAAPASVWPLGSEHPLVAILHRDSDPNAREAAAAALRAAPATIWTAEFAQALATKLDPQREGNPAVREAAAAALESAPAAVWTPTLAQVLATSLDSQREGSPTVRKAAAAALGAAPASVWSLELTQVLLASLDPQRENTSVRFAAAAALEAAPAFVWSPELAQALFTSLDPQREHDPGVRNKVSDVLRAAPSSVWSFKFAQALVAKLDPSETSSSRSIAATALEAAPPSFWSPDLAQALVASLDPQREHNPDVRQAFAMTLRAAPPDAWTSRLVLALAASLDPQREHDPEVRQAIVRTIMYAPASVWTSSFAQMLAASLERQMDWDIRIRIAEALGAAPASAWTPQLAQTLAVSLDPQREYEPQVRQAVARALAAAPDSLLAELSTIYAKQELWATETLEVLASSQALTATEILPLLENILRGNVDEATRWRALAHVLTGGGHELAWLGRPETLPLDKVRGDPAAAYTELALLYALKPELEKQATLAGEAHRAAGRIAVEACQGTDRQEPVTDGLAHDVLAKMGGLLREGPVGRCWSVTQAALVGQIADWIASTDGPRSAEIRRQLERDASAAPWRNLLWGASGWIMFWTAMIVVFPTSRHVQGAILFQPWARKYLSLGVVPVLLVLSPWLRRRILRPFQDDLLGDARLDDMDKLGFYGGGRARRGDAEPMSVERALDHTIGVVILRGEAGLGKTSALRRLCGRSPPPVAFLHARDCKEGVAEAITHRMKSIQDIAFVRSAVHAGAMMVIVDGLNEVSADAREVVRSFAADNRKARILIGTQPIEWTPPAGATVIDLLRYSKDEAEEFLLSRPIGADPGQRVHGEAYREAVRAFLRRAFDQAPTAEDREAAELILSNPFDLTFAADLIAQNVPLTPRGIVDEAFRLADEGPGDHAYSPTTGRPFPLEAFARHAVEMRLQDRNWLRSGEFEAERPCLIERKLLVQRVVRVGPAETDQREIFRHDRVWDFFIVAAFRSDPDLLERHIDDARFRGAYLRIAETWPESHARVVRDLVVESAARSNDNTTSNEFVRRLLARRTGTRSLITPVGQVMSGETA